MQLMHRTGSTTTTTMLTLSRRQTSKTTDESSMMVRTMLSAKVTPITIQGRSSPSLTLRVVAGTRSNASGLAVAIRRAQGEEAHRGQRRAVDLEFPGPRVRVQSRPRSQSGQTKSTDSPSVQSMTPTTKINSQRTTTTFQVHSDRSKASLRSASSQTSPRAIRTAFRRPSHLSGKRSIDITRVARRTTICHPYMSRSLSLKITDQ